MKKILICEDDIISRMLISMILNRRYELTEAINGCDAINLIKHNDYDLILSDLNLPCSNGFDILNFMRSVNKTIPLIIISGYTEITILEEARKLGANDYIIKPYGDSTLLDKINNILK
jgi:two-component system, NtrC family, response regulator HydG